MEDLVTVISEWKKKQEAEEEPADGQPKKRKMPGWFKDDEQGAAEMILPAGKSTHTTRQRDRWSKPDREIHTR